MDECKVCNGSKEVMGYGYGSDGKGGIQQYMRIMGCQACNDDIWEATTTVTSSHDIDGSFNGTFIDLASF